MKKHDEGYALVLVLVVMLVLCLVATSVLTIALNNLKKQETSVARMKAKYEAQGKIEEFYANLQYDITTYTVAYLEDGSEIKVTKYPVPQNFLSYINKDAGVVVSGSNEEDGEPQLGILEVKEGDTELRIRIKAYSGGSDPEKTDARRVEEQVCITCVLVLKSNVPVIIDVLDDKRDDDPGNDIVDYWLVDPVLSYSAYEVTVVTPEEGGPGE